jgi:microcystin-dependent protein
MKRFFGRLCGLFVLLVFIYAQEAFKIIPNGNVGIGVDNPSAKLEVAGDIKASGDITTTGRVQDASGLVMPVGTILPYALDQAPAGWLICDGSVIDKSANPALTDLVDGLRASAGGNADHPYVAGLTEDQARLPDLRGDFVRGVSGMQNPAGVSGVTPPAAARTDADPDAAARVNPQTGTVVNGVVGSWQNDAFQTHAHNGQVYRGTITPTQGGGSTSFHDISHTDSGWTSSRISIGAPTGTGVRTSSETRADNTYVLYIIKY